MNQEDHLENQGIVQGIELNRVVNFIENEEVITQLTCLICWNILDQPKDCQFCQAAFCNSCILNWVQASHIFTCPACAKRDWISKNKYLILFLNMLKIRCRNKDYGCNKVLSYENLQNHENNICDYRGIRPLNQEMIVKYVTVEESNDFKSKYDYLKKAIYHKECKYKFLKGLIDRIKFQQ